MSRILLVEDDQLLTKTLVTFLAGKKLLVRAAATCQQARDVYQPGQFDVVILDRSLPDGDGLELVAEFSADVTTRFFVMSNLRGVTERLQGWRQGIDDYLEKPFSLEEWWWRLKRLLSSEKVPQQDELALGGLTFFPLTGQICLGNHCQQLRRREAGLLHLLFRRLNQVVSRDEMIDRVWRGADVTPSYATIDVYIRRLRLALGPAAGYLQTRRGFGYCLQSLEVTELK